ncbi:hypothetical protein BJ741DRAFT_624374 [Chytriomyces cf. hyalinus JEL632]|nr:hypothetical protein BJ741DRAFT_624374 [Chytriomyces cf. hyalinus JEL632]
MVPAVARTRSDDSSQHSFDRPTTRIEATATESRTQTQQRGLDHYPARLCGVVDADTELPKRTSTSQASGAYGGQVEEACTLLESGWTRAALRARAFETASCAVSSVLEDLACAMSSQDCVDNHNSVAAAAYVEWIAEDRVHLLRRCIDTPQMQMETLSILLDTCLVTARASLWPSTKPSCRHVGPRPDTHAPILLFLLDMGIVETNVLNTWIRLLKSLSAKNHLCMSGLSQVVNQCEDFLAHRQSRATKQPQLATANPYPRFVRIPPRRSLSNSSSEKTLISQEQTATCINAAAAATGSKSQPRHPTRKEPLAWYTWMQYWG